MPISVTADAGTDELTWASAHGCSTGEMVSFTGTMPSPLVAGTSYYAIVSSATVMKVATTRDNALASTAIDLTTAGSSILGTRDTGRAGEVNLSVQDGNGQVSLSNVPLAVKLTVDGLVADSHVRVTRADNDELLFNLPESGGLITISTKYKGLMNIEARKADTSPYYKPWYGSVALVDTPQTVTAIQVRED